MVALASLFIVIGTGQVPEQEADIFKLPPMQWQHHAQGEKNWDRIEIPRSTLHTPADAGTRAHTCLVVRAIGGKEAAVHLKEETLDPQKLRTIYSLPSSGGSGTIAIVDAGDFGTALNDFNLFSRQYDLPTEHSTDVTSSKNKVFQVVYAGGSKPASAGWELEEALDIEYAHAMAPGAKILLVEANSNLDSDLYAAVREAGHLVGEKKGKGEVSMSFGGDEFSGQTQYDSDFEKKGVVYFAASGDTGGVTSYPSTSPLVVAVGGTTIKLKSDGSFGSETGWGGSGGGISQFEPPAPYQAGLLAKIGPHRGVPDVSFEADPGSGVLVYNSTPDDKGEVGWWIVGGTSVACPCFAGVVNLAGHFEKSSLDELLKIYTKIGSSSFRDIVSGLAGSRSCGKGWDEVTGCGSPVGLDDK